MTSKLIDIYAGHYNHAGSDKVWGGALVERGPTSRVFVSCWGKRGASLQSKVDASPKATDNFARKRGEKLADGYQSIDPHLYGIVQTMALMMAEHERGWTSDLPTGDGDSVTMVTPPVAASLTSTAPRVIVSHVMPMSAGELEQALTNANVGLTEKVNGTRSPLEWTGFSLQSYNRKGQALYSVPTGAERLRGLKLPALIDGERMEGKWAEHYVMFDLLEVNGNSVRDQPYMARITQLEALLAESGVAASHRAWIEEGGVPLHLLLPCVEESTKRGLLRWLEESGREGVVTRTLSGTSIAGNTTYERKWKFLSDIDAIVLGTNLDKGTASVRLGLLRPSDGAIIEIGSVRSGLRDEDVARIQARLSDFPAHAIVTKVGFLRARTVGVSLVEPTMYPGDVRTDKDWTECVTDQLVDIFGAERVPAIESARAVEGGYRWQM